MAHDQRYCISCGARHGLLARRYASIFAALDMPAPPIVSGVPPMLLAPPESAAGSGLAGALEGLLGPTGFPSARVIAAAALSMLAAGILIGAFVGGTGGVSPMVVMPAAEQAAQVAPEQAAEQTTADQTSAAEETTAEAAPEEEQTTTTTETTAEIKRIWLIVLSGQSYEQSFGADESTSYLVNTLASQGALLADYSSLPGSELANTRALVSGLDPTTQINQNCPLYSELPSESATDGCVAAEDVRTIADTLTAGAMMWSVYAEGADNAEAGRAGTCQVPELGQQDPFFTATEQSPFTTWSNPLLYFRSVTSSPSCGALVQGLGGLAKDLKASGSSQFNLVIPDRCHAGSPVACGPGATAGLDSSNDFLKETVTSITASDDYKNGGLIAITFDRPGVDPAQPTAATAETSDAELPAGKVGLLLISPSVQAGSVVSEGGYNHYSLLRSISNWLGLSQLGHADDSSVLSIPDEVVGLKK